MKDKIIHSRKIAYELRKLGFKIVRVEPNKFKPQFDCYFFEETPELITALKKVTGKD